MLDIIFGKIADQDNYVKTVTRQHGNIHDGEMFCYNYNASIGAGSTALFYIVTPNTTCRVRFTAVHNSTGANIITYFGSAVYDPASTGYTALTAINRNLQSTKTAASIVGYCASSSLFSTYAGIMYSRMYLQPYFFQGSISGGNMANQWILQQNTGYVLACNHISAYLANIQIRLVENG